MVKNKPAENGAVQTPPSVEPVAEDPQVSAKLAELDAVLKKTKEINERLEKKEKELDERLAKPVLPSLSAAEEKKVAELHKAKAQRMKEHLAKQPKVKIYVPLDGKEKPGTVLPVTLNGYRLNVPKGVYVEVPQQVAEIVMDSLNQTQAAENHPLRLDLQSEERQKALT